MAYRAPQWRKGMFSDTKERQNMSEYGMGFAPCEKPMGASGRYEKVLEAFWAGDDECIGCEFDDLKKAKTAQAAISAVARKKFSGIKCRREGATVYVVKGQ